MRPIRLVVVMLLVLTALGLRNAATPAMAAGFCPSSEQDIINAMNSAGGGTVMLSCPSDTTIYFDTANGHNGNGAPITSANNVTLDASSSPGTITLDGGGSVQLFNLYLGGVLTLNGLTFAHGYATALGGAISMLAQATVRITNSTFTGNYAGSATGGLGGAIYDGDGSVATITNSTFTSNKAGSSPQTAGGKGGAIDVDVGGVAIITNSTFSGNSASFGAGIYDLGDATVANSTFVGNAYHAVRVGEWFNPTPGRLRISHSTFSGNTVAISNEARVFITDSTIANDTSTAFDINSPLFGSSMGGTILANNADNCSGHGSLVTDAGYNVFDGKGCTAVVMGPTDLTNTDPELDPNGLQNNGGPTQTIALLAGSPAIDRIPTSNSSLCSTGGTDQRGYALPDDLESVCDVGAYESAYPDTLPPTVTVTVPSPVYGQNGWFGAQDAPVSVSVSATDVATGGSPIQHIDCTLDGNVVSVSNLTGIGSSPTASGAVQVAGDGVHTVACTATDAAGNTSQASTGTVRIDTTPPSLTSSATSGSQPYSSGSWTNAPVVVSFACTDATSGVAGATSPVTVSSEGANQSVSGNCTDFAGNTTSTTFSGINIDQIPPLLSGAPASPPNSNGWYNGDVPITWTCSDALSGVSGSCPSTTVTGEGTGLTSSASVTDRAGNTTVASSSPSVNIDRTAPVTTAGAPGGWSNTDVSLILSASDTLSGVQETDYIIDGGSRQIYQPGATLTFSAEGVHTLTYWSVDKAGNTETAHTIQIKIDKTAPTITSAATPAANGNGWNKSSVSVTFTCTDALSGIKSCDGSPTSPGVSTVATEGLGQLLTGTAVDNASNTATDPVVLNIDETAPSVSGSVFPAANANGWNNTPVNVSFTCSDPKNANGTPGSGIAGCSAPTTLSAEGSGQSVTGTATDGAGNTTSTTIGNIKIDTTPPTITFVSQTPAATSSGWNNGPVTVTWSCTDALSGATQATVTATVSAEGANQSVTGTCTDNAGNSASATRTGINIDRTPPTLAPTVSPNPVLLNGSATATPNATDALSGIASQSCASVVTSSVGNQSVICSATDKAGNTASKAASYTVVYGQNLLYNTGSQYKSGTTVPIALRLLDAKGTNVSSAGVTVTAVAVVNSSGAVVRSINAPFTFKAPQYTYNLNTTGLTTGTYNLQFTAGNDPTTHLAPFSIR